MKKLTLQSIAALLVAVLISFSSCSKEGPEGPAGPQGNPGPTGNAGPQGPAGTANVIYSEWLTNDFEEILNDEDEVVGYGLALPATDVTADIINSGEIKVYVNLNTAADPVISALPYNDGEIFIDAIYRTSTIIITSNADLSDVAFRYILIPGGTAASGRSSGPAVDWNDYNAVKKYLNLKD